MAVVVAMVDGGGSGDGGWVVVVVVVMMMMTRRMRLHFTGYFSSTYLSDQHTNWTHITVYLPTGAV